MGKVTFSTGSFTGSIGTDAAGNLELQTMGNAKQILFDKAFGVTGSVDKKRAFVKSGSQVIEMKVDAVSGNLTFTSSKFEMSMKSGSEFILGKETTAENFYRFSKDGNISYSKDYFQITNKNIFLLCHT